MTEDLTQADLAEIEKMLGSPMALPSDFTSWWVEWLAGELQPQVLALGGAALIFFRSATVIATPESTTSTTYTDLSTVGPQLTGLSNGRWLFFWGCNHEASGGATICYMAIDAGGGPSDDYAARMRTVQDGDIAPGMYAQLVTLTGNDNNTVTAKYRKLSGSTPIFRERWLVGVRLGNV